jgi:hypothetical protein
MDEQERRWLVAEVARLRELERRRIRRMLLVWAALIGAAIIGCRLLMMGLGRLIDFLFPYGIG